MTVRTLRRRSTFLLHMQYILTAMISLRSTLRRKVLTFFYFERSARIYVRELAKALGVDSTNLSRELARLEQQGLLRSEIEGRQRYYSLDPEYPYQKPVMSLLQGSVGLPATLRAGLKQVSGIEQAYLYGSFAKQEADVSSDIDLLIIGTPDATQLASAAARLERMLRRELNYTVLTPQELKRKLSYKDALLTDIWQGRRIDIFGNEQNKATVRKRRAGKTISRRRATARKHGTQESGD